jgi:hypothetical protein
MNNGNHMHFAMAIHMLQKSNPATRQDRDDMRATARRHLGRLEPSADRRLTTQNAHEG